MKTVVTPIKQTKKRTKVKSMDPGLPSLGTGFIYTWIQRKGKFHQVSRGQAQLEFVFAVFLLCIYFCRLS